MGNVIICSAFITYGGYFDQFYRNLLLSTWKSKMNSLGLKYKDDLDIGEYLSNQSEKMKWESCGLPSDDICIQNAIILSRFNRYPLIIDPDG